jgi:hypothetical protein
MIAATASSTSGASSRFIDRSAANRVEIRVGRVQEYRHAYLSALPGPASRLRPSNRSDAEGEAGIRQWRALIHVNCDN